MKTKFNYDQNRKKIINYIKRNPKTTDREIRKNIKLHPNRYFNNGMKEAYILAKINSPRTFNRKTIEERQEILKIK